MNLGELNASSTEQITKWNCFAMKLWAHCQRCLVCSECLIWENACVQTEIQFPRWGLESLHHATATWFCQTLDLGPGEQRFQAHISKALAPSPTQCRVQYINWGDGRHRHSIYSLRLNQNQNIFVSLTPNASLTQTLRTVVLLLYSQVRTMPWE